MKKNITSYNISDQVTKLPSMQNEAMGEIIIGLYAGKSLRSAGGLL